jgi:Outer membrane lipoprotein
MKYGYIISSTPVKIKGEGSWVGATAGGLLGGLLGTQVCGEKDDEVAGTKCQDVAIVYGTIGGAAIGYVTEAILGNHDGFQYVVDVDDKENDIAVVQGDKEVLQNGERVILLYGDVIRVLPFAE